MSGICGVLAFDGVPPSLGPVVKALERRGPDATRSWTDGSVTLGHTLLATTPEALAETLPLTDESSGCTITADVRIDNRDELMMALGIVAGERIIGDGEMILRAYLKWGEDCPKKLLGDFAFAIWDPSKQRLLCARDQMGMRQFNYCHVPGDLFTFATEDTALLALDRVPKTLNEERIADLILDLECVETTSTFFAHVHRLPAAHTLVVEASKCTIRRYWTLRPPAPLRLASDDLYAAAFLEIFTEAVRCRLRSAGGVGAMLSGGLDSSSIVAVAAGILAVHGERLTTLSAIGENSAQCVETRSIRSAMTIEGLDPVLIGSKQFESMSHRLIEELKEIRNPFEVHGTMLRGIYLTAKERGLKIVIDGGAGDVTLTSSNRISALLSQFRFKQALREADGEARFWNVDRPIRFKATLIASGAWVAVVPASVRSIWRNIRLSRTPTDIEPQFAKRIKLRERRIAADAQNGIKTKGDVARRAQSIAHPNLVAGRERFDQLSGAFGIECRDPFMDLRLIDFCLSLPAEQLRYDGWSKTILRRAIDHLVPSDIAWRRGKEHLGSSYTHFLLAKWGDWQSIVSPPPSQTDRYASQKAMIDLRCGKGIPGDVMLRLMALDRFLKRYVERTDGH